MGRLIIVMLHCRLFPESVWDIYIIIYCTDLEVHIRIRNISWSFFQKKAMCENIISFNSIRICIFETIVIGSTRFCYLTSCRRCWIMYIWFLDGGMQMFLSVYYICSTFFIFLQTTIYHFYCSEICCCFYCVCNSYSLSVFNKTNCYVWWFF